MEKSTFDKMGDRIRNSVMLKLLTITILMLLLLIPSTMIKSIIAERELLSKEAILEVSAKWANAQEIIGPIITIPLIYEQIVEEKKVQTTKYMHILPEELKIDGSIEPEKLKRGIYEIVVYKSNIEISGNFDLNKKIDQNNLIEILYDQAFLTLGISDLRGIEDQIDLEWNSSKLKVEPGSKLSSIANSGITAEIPELLNSMKEPVPFSISVSLQGSQNISFVPLGSETNVTIASTWPSPSFNGNFLPKNREVSDDGFTASWKVLELNRNYPQSWTGTDYIENIRESSFGVDLFLPVDDYQKSMRSAKYAVMSIALTFLIFFMVEILNKRKIHPFQYALVGLGLVLFYILLVSISEHSNFNLAYLISSIAVVCMISLYSLSVFKDKKLSLLLFVIITAIYGFLFVTLQLADYALLMGSAGLTLILAATMYFSRNINWYNLNQENE
ncbi:MAG: cell envelope integrity protein CreD [Bacteroidales bacterium]|nr:cell envelope integrity protein CreD [Bacteroidales bacterium]MCF8389845.1 cell envelope integrity protein CreD [Bacteroidales bacterium]